MTMWSLLSSKRFAIYVLAIFLAMLVVSSFLPNHFTLTEMQWHELERSKPILFWIASHGSTPFLVESPLFLLVSLFLFLSTLACTVTRVSRWSRLRTSEFSKEKAFSFALDGASSLNLVAVQHKVRDLLHGSRWDFTSEQTGGSISISGQKGRSGLWGSVVFHLGLIICFLAGPVTVLTNFRGELILTEEETVPLRAGFESHEGKSPAALPDVGVRVEQVQGEYFQDQYQYDFRGTLIIDQQQEHRALPFAVNEPAAFSGYEFQLHAFGYAPRLIVERSGTPIFDYLLNLRHPVDGDHFSIDQELRAFVLFFPDFIRDGSKLSSKSRTPKNPVFLVRILQGDHEVLKGLFKPGEERSFGDYRIRIPEYRHWVSLIVVREWGIIFVAAGFVIGVAGLFVRFLSNERRIEIEVSPFTTGTLLTLRGYSRYYPAFLEKEVLEMAGKLIEQRT